VGVCCFYKVNKIMYARSLVLAINRGWGWEEWGRFIYIKSIRLDM